MKNLFWFIFLMIPTSLSHVCKIFQNFPLRRILFIYEIEVFLLKRWALHRFSVLFPFRGSGCAVYICLVGGVVIFDESWAGKGIDSRVNTVHVPVFSDAEVNPAANLTYSENRLADIHGNDSGAHCEVMYFISVWENSFLINSEKCCFFSSLNEGSTLGSVSSG